MKQTKEITKSLKYDCLQIAIILQLGKLDREVVRVKYPKEVLTEKQWKDLLKKIGYNF